MSEPLTAIVPVKSLRHAKTRLRVAAELRRALALAFALDTIDALLDATLLTEVVVVTADREVERRLQPWPVRLVTERAPGLGAAIDTGVRAAAVLQGPGSGYVVVPADLPCLRPADVASVLGRMPGQGGAFVPDRAGTGTTMMIDPSGRESLAAYGPYSAARHLALGLRPLLDAPVRTRYDVDTVDDLDAARALGVGSETAAVLAQAEGRDEAAGSVSRHWPTSP